MKKFGRKALGKVVGVVGTILNTQKAYGLVNYRKQLKDKYGFKEFGGDGSPLPKKKKTKMSLRKPKQAKYVQRYSLGKKNF